MGSAFLGGVDFDPGYGLMLSGLAMVAIAGLAGALFLVSFTRMSKLPIAVTFGNVSPQQPGPSTQGLPSGQWPPSGPQQSG